MSASKVFTTAARDSDYDDEPADVEFRLDDRELTAIFPGDGQVAMLMAETSRHQDLQTKVAGAIDFFQSCFPDDQAAHLRTRLLTKRDPFGIQDVQDIVEYLLEEWSGRPTRSPSGSTRSRSNGGQRSKPSTRRSA